MNELFDIKTAPKKPAKRRNALNSYELTKFHVRSRKSESLKEQDIETRNSVYKQPKKSTYSLSNHNQEKNEGPFYVKSPGLSSNSIYQLRLKLEELEDQQRGDSFSSSHPLQPPSGHSSPVIRKSKEIGLPAPERDQKLSTFSRYLQSKAFSWQEPNIDSDRENIKMFQPPETSITTLKDFNKYERRKERRPTSKKRPPKLQSKCLEDDDLDLFSFPQEEVRNDVKDSARSVESSTRETKKLYRELKTKRTDKEAEYSESEKCESATINIEERENRSSEAEEKRRKNEKKQKLNLKFWEYLWSFVCRTESLKMKTELLNEGAKHIDERLDVINILKKLREIDKLRALLLDHDQLILFNNLPKPEIRPKGLLQSSGTSSFTNIVLRWSQFIEGVATEMQVKEAYDKLKYKVHKTKIDQRLLEIFDENKL